MKQVYQCDYCSHTGHRNEIMGHEVKCSFNPSNKNCYSCRHFISQELHIFAMDECNADNPDLFDVLDNDIECDLWEEKL